MTVTANPEKHSNRYQKYSVFDTGKVGEDFGINNEELRRNILILSEALVHLIYSFKDKEITYFIDNNLLVSDSYLNQTKAFLAKNPRAPHLIQRDSPVSKELSRLLGLNVNQVKRMGVLVNSVLFFEEKLENKVQSYLVTSKLQELYMFFAVLAYLIAMYLGF